jgi:hypothetical protein
MKNVDVEIYINNFITFFKNNPNDLIELIGDILQEDFFKKVKEKSYENLEKGSDVSLTQKQLIDIVVELKKLSNHEIDINKIESIFIQTPFGQFSLN